MKLIVTGAASILLSVSLTSCRPQTQIQAPQEDIAPLTERAISTSNVIYLDQVVRGQDATARFNEIIKSGNVVVDFFAHWCGPCKKMGSIIDQIAEQFPSITFLKVDTDQFRTIGSDVQSIPTLVFYKDGMKIHRVSGAKEKNVFKALLTQFYQLNPK